MIVETPLGALPLAAVSLPCRGRCSRIRSGRCGRSRRASHRAHVVLGAELSATLRGAHINKSAKMATAAISAIIVPPVPQRRRNDPASDHLITHANADTYADSRLIFCVCKAHHDWKSLGSSMRKAQYDAVVKEILPPERVTLWERCEADSWRPVRTTAYDWKLLLAALRQELRDHDCRCRKPDARGITWRESHHAPGSGRAPLSDRRKHRCPRRRSSVQ